MWDKYGPILSHYLECSLFLYFYHNLLGSCRASLVIRESFQNAIKSSLANLNVGTRHKLAQLKELRQSRNISGQRIVGLVGVIPSDNSKLNTMRLSTLKVRDATPVW